MDIGPTLDCRNASHRVASGWMHGLLRILARLFGRCAFKILRLFSPIVLPFLFWLAAGGVAIWVVFVGVAHDGEFPSAGVLLMSLGCLLAAGGYCLLMEWLRPT